MVLKGDKGLPVITLGSFSGNVYFPSTDFFVLYRSVLYCGLQYFVVLLSSMDRNLGLQYAKETLFIRIFGSIYGSEQSTASEWDEPLQ